MKWQELEKKLKEIDSSSDFIDGMYTFLDNEENYKKMLEVLENENISDTDTAIYKMIEIIDGKEMVNWEVISKSKKL